jgi:hypothetical protein
MASWLFLNHISLMLFCKLVEALHAQQLSTDYSPEDIIDMVRNVYLVKYGYEEPIISDWRSTVHRYKSVDNSIP